jgi:hypothetical protein
LKCTHPVGDNHLPQVQLARVLYNRESSLCSALQCWQHWAAVPLQWHRQTELEISYTWQSHISILHPKHAYTVIHVVISSVLQLLASWAVPWQGMTSSSHMSAQQRHQPINRSINRHESAPSSAATLV